MAALILSSYTIVALLVYLFLLIDNRTSRKLAKYDDYIVFIYLLPSIFWLPLLIILGGTISVRKYQTGKWIK